MSIRAVTCPGCGTTVNVPIAMANVKCPSCAAVWNVNNPSAVKTNSHAKSKAVGSSSHDDSTESPNVSVVMIGALVGGGLLLFTMVGVAAVMMNRESAPASNSTNEPVAVEDTIKPAIPEEYRVIRLPEETRKRIYSDYRKVARTTVETPLMVPQGTRLRQATEGMLEGVFDRELNRFAALHDITVDDVKEVIKEGDAKGWDGSPRSNAVRDGKRVYSTEMSEGWEKNPNQN